MPSLRAFPDRPQNSYCLQIRSGVLSSSLSLLWSTQPPEALKGTGSTEPNRQNNIRNHDVFDICMWGPLTLYQVITITLVVRRVNNLHGLSKRFACLIEKFPERHVNEGNCNLKLFLTCDLQLADYICRCTWQSLRSRTLSYFTDRVRYHA